MVQFIYNYLKTTAEKYSSDIRNASCYISKPSILVPDGKNIEQVSKDGGVIIYPYYDESQLQIDDLWAVISTSNYPKIILTYASKHILGHQISKIYTCLTKADIYERVSKDFKGIGFCPVKSLNNFLLFPIIKDPHLKAQIDNEISALSLEIKNNSYRPGRYTINYTQDFICNGTNLTLSDQDKEIKKSTLDKLKTAYSSIMESIISLENDFFHYQEKKNIQLKETIAAYNQSHKGICDLINFLLEDSLYPFIFPKEVVSQYDETSHTLITDYILPAKDKIPNEIISKSGKKWIELTPPKHRRLYDDIIYSVVLRSLAEICHYDNKGYIEHICFNGKIKDRSPLTGQIEEKYILSVHVSREQVESLNLEFIDPKECFKYLKGISASKLYEQTEIRPILTPSFSDKRIITAREVETTQSTNLAEMAWEEFEHLVRQVFEWEFSDKGGEVNVTQSSRDGGVDAIVFDPDPIRGGKIIIQAKRYTNTVPVSAVRDLYGTIINEGANKGILITTSDYGPDSYKFAQGKPITLLNGGHLLYLMEKHGRHARIDIQEAKNKNKGIN